jgi:hypothetical protein
MSMPFGRPQLKPKPTPPLGDFRRGTKVELSDKGDWLVGEITAVEPEYVLVDVEGKGSVRITMRSAAARLRFRDDDETTGASADGMRGVARDVRNEGDVGNGGNDVGVGSGAEGGDAEGGDAEGGVAVGGVAVGGAVGGVGGGAVGDGAVGDGAAENEVDVEVEVEGPVDQTVNAAAASILATFENAMHTFSAQVSAQDDNEKEEALACIEAKKDAAVKAAMEAYESERAAYLDGLEEKKRKRTGELTNNIVQLIRAYATDGQRKQARA